jgi:hypothetical protein
MGFWRYFKDTLNYPLIRRDGAAARLAEGGAGALDAAPDHFRWLRDQGLPEYAEAANLELIGRGRGLSRWPVETDEFWRKRVAGAYRWHLMGGTRRGLSEFLRLAGVTADIVEPRDAEAALADIPGWDGDWSFGDGTIFCGRSGSLAIPTLRWAEFAVRMNMADYVDPGTEALCIRLVREIKPARSVPIWLYMIRFRGMAGPVVSALVRDKGRASIYFWSGPRWDGGWEFGADDPIGWDGSRVWDGSWFYGALAPVSADEVWRHHFLRGVIRTGIMGARPRGYLDRTLDRNSTFDGSWHWGILRPVGGFGASAERVSAAAPGVRDIYSRLRLRLTVDYPQSPAVYGHRRRWRGWDRFDGAWTWGSCMSGPAWDGSWALATPGWKGSGSALETVVACTGPARRWGGWGVRFGDARSRLFNGAWRWGGGERRWADGRLFDGSWRWSVPHWGAIPRRFDGSWRWEWEVDAWDGSWRFGASPSGAAVHGRVY